MVLEGQQSFERREVACPRCWVYEQLGKRTKANQLVGGITLYCPGLGALTVGSSR